MARRTKAEALVTRENILNSALDIFSEKSYSNVSVVEIAAKAGVTKGAVYWHFKGKDEIILKIVEESCKKNESDFLDIYGTPKSLLALRNFYKESLVRPTQDERYKKIHSMMFHRHEWPKDLQAKMTDIVSESMSREVQMLETLISKAQAAGKVRLDVDARHVASLTSSVFRGLFVLQLAEMLPSDFIYYSDFLFDALSHELDARKDYNIL